MSINFNNITAQEAAALAVLLSNNTTEEAKRAAIHAYPEGINALVQPPLWLQIEAIKAAPALFLSSNVIDKENETIQIELVKARPKYLQHVQNPSEAVIDVALNADIEAIEFVKEPSEKWQIAAVEKSWRNIKLINSPCEQAQIMAAPFIQSFSGTDYNIVIQKTTSQEAKNLALDTQPYLIEHFDQPTQEMIEKAVKLAPDLLLSWRFQERFQEQIENLRALARNSYFGSDDIDIIKAKLAENPGMLGLLDKPSEELQLFVATNYKDNLSYSTALSYIDKDKESIQLAILKSGITFTGNRNDLHEAISYLENPTEAAQLYVIENGSYRNLESLFEKVPNPSEEVQLAIINKEVGYWTVIQNPSEAVQMFVARSGVEREEKTGDCRRKEGISNRTNSEEVRDYLQNPKNYDKKLEARFTAATPEEQLKLLKLKPDLIQKAENPTEEMQKTAADYGYKKPETPSPEIRSGGLAQFIQSILSLIGWNK